MRWTRLFLICGLLAGCDTGSEPDAPVEPAAEPAPAEAPPPAAAPAKPAAEAGPVVEEPIFRLAMDTGEQYESGKPGAFQVTLVGKGGYHVNQDYPTKVAVTAVEPVTVDKPTLGKADAKEFTEEKALFEVPFNVASAGEHKVTCKVDFAVCTEATCVPETRTIAAVVNVK